MWEGYPYLPLRKDFPLEGKSSDVDEVAFTDLAPLDGGPFVTAHGRPRRCANPGRAARATNAPGTIRRRALIADHPGLIDLIARISPLSRIAVDTEADSLHSYYEKLCLIQIGTELDNVLLDPLEGDRAPALVRGAPKQGTHPPRRRLRSAFA